MRAQLSPFSAWVGETGFYNCWGGEDGSCHSKNHTGCSGPELETRERERERERERRSKRRRKRRGEAASGREEGLEQTLGFKPQALLPAGYVTLDKSLNLSVPHSTIHLTTGLG